MLGVPAFSRRHSPAKPAKYSHRNSSWTSTPSGSMAGRNSRSGRMEPAIETTRIDSSQTNALRAQGATVSATVSTTRHRGGGAVGGGGRGVWGVT